VFIVSWEEPTTLQTKEKCSFQLNQFEIEGFLKSRGCSDTGAVLNDLKSDDKVVSINYKCYDTYRLKLIM
jgi:hypothetical protein